MNSEQPNSENQDWDVFRYVSGEMSAIEENQFEERLSDDHQLREQVASMVSTMAAVDRSCASHKLTLAKSTRSNQRRVRRIVVAAAALVLLASLAVSLSPKPELSESGAESVAVAWAESIEEFELPDAEDDFEFASFEFDGDDDWIVDVVAAANEESSIN